MTVADVRTRILARDVVVVSAEHFALTPGALMGRSREAPVIAARYLASRIIRDLCPEAMRSYPRIGGLLGGRDHSTVRAGVDKIETRLRTEPELRLAYIEITRRLTMDEAQRLDDQIEAAVARVAELRDERAALTQSLEPGA